jgi:hypothetical protein
MKKIILYIFFALPSYSISQDPKIISSKSWRKNFKKINHGQLKKTLGYDPKLELIEDNNPKVISQGGPTLYIHGWLSSKNATLVRNRCNDSSRIPGDVIIFNFPDASEWINNSIPYYMPLNKSSFGQENEIRALLCIIKVLYDVGISIPIYYPHSRGGAVLKKVIGILNQPSQEWRMKLKTLNFTKQNRNAILSSLKIVYFNAPLKNIHLMIKKNCENTLSFITYYLPCLKPFVSKNLTNFIEKRLFPIITSFNPQDTREPIEYLNDWKGLNTTVVLHFQYPDYVVPNEDSIKCAKILLTLNSDKTYVIIGNDGDHGFGDITIAKIIHALNKKLNCSYLEKTTLLDNGQTLLDANKPTLDTVEDHILSSNRICSESDRNKTSSTHSKISLYTVAAALGIFYYFNKNNRSATTISHI